MEILDNNKFVNIIFNECNRGYLIFSMSDEFLFHRMNKKAVFSRVAKARVKIPVLVFMSEIKINLIPAKNPIFCFFNAKIRKNN